MLHYSIIIWLNPVFFCNILVSQWFLTPKDFPRKLLHSDMADHCSWWPSHYSMVLRNLEDTDTCSHEHHQHMCPHYSKVMQSGYTHLCWPHNGLLEDIFNNKQWILQPSLIMFLNNGFNKLRRLLMGVNNTVPDCCMVRVHNEVQGHAPWEKCYHITNFTNYHSSHWIRA